MRKHKWLFILLLHVAVLAGCSATNGQGKATLECTLKVNGEKPKKEEDSYKVKVGDTITVSAQFTGAQAKKVRWNVQRDYIMPCEYFGEKDSNERKPKVEEHLKEEKENLEIALDGISIDEPWEMTTTERHEFSCNSGILLRCGLHDNPKTLTKPNEVTFFIKVMKDKEDV